MIIKKIFFQNMAGQQVKKVGNEDVSTSRVNFSGASSLVGVKSVKRLKFENLPSTEKRAFSGLINRFIFPLGKEILMTLLGHKPATLLYGFNYNKVAELLKRHKSLIESKNIKIMQGRDFRGLDECYIFHLPKLKENAEKNIDFYRMKFGDQSLTADKIVKLLTSKGGALFNIKDEALTGVTLGYPAPDAIIFGVEGQIQSTLYQLVKLGKYTGHENKMVQIAARFNPKAAESMRNQHRQCAQGSVSYSLSKPYANLAPIKKEDAFFDFPRFSKIRSKYYTFASYANCDETNGLIKQIKRGIANTQRTFKTPKDVLNYLLDKNK